jgi:hypothetical protein
MEINMTPTMKESLTSVITAIAHGDSTAATAAFHSYLKEKTHVVLESKDEDDDEDDKDVDDSDDGDDDEDDKPKKGKKDKKDDKDDKDDKSDKLPPWLKDKKKK